MKIFDAVVNNQALRITPHGVLIAPTRKFYEIDFTFCHVWDDYEKKTVAFINQETEEKYLVELTNNKILPDAFPLMVSWYGGNYTMDVWGENFDSNGNVTDRITTNAVAIRITKNNRIELE